MTMTKRSLLGLIAGAAALAARPGAGQIPRPPDHVRGAVPPGGLHGRHGAHPGFTELTRELARPWWWRNCRRGRQHRGRSVARQP